MRAFKAKLLGGIWECSEEEREREGRGEKEGEKKRMKYFKEVKRREIT